MPNANTNHMVAEPGEPYPLGATWDGNGVNFALFSAHAEKGVRCLVEARGNRAVERVALETKLKEIIHHDEDQVLFIGLGPAESRGDRTIMALGQAYHHFDQPCYVV